jgi:hypothetical protein
LIQVKTSSISAGYVFWQPGEMTMTTQTILVLAGIVTAFATFGIVLAWADFYSQGAPKPVNKDLPTTRQSASNWNEEKRAA